MLVQPMKQPVYCRLPAFHLFTESLPALDTTDGLINAAIAISMHALDDVQPEEIHAQISAIAARVKGRVRSGTSSALVAHLHEVLFEEERFCGNSENYYSAINSYLPCVLRQKKGLPIVLALVYKAVADHVGIGARGINSPGHFLMWVEEDHKPIIVDPFFRGQLLTQAEAFERLRHVTNRPIPRDERLLMPATHRQWIGRMLTNLQALFHEQGNVVDEQAMGELSQALRTSNCE